MLNVYVTIVLAFWLVKLTKKQGAYVDGQNWQAQRPTGQTGLSSCNPSRLRSILEILV